MSSGQRGGSSAPLHSVDELFQSRVDVPAGQGGSHQLAPVSDQAFTPAGAAALPAHSGADLAGVDNGRGPLPQRPPGRRSVWRCTAVRRADGRAPFRHPGPPEVSARSCGACRGCWWGPASFRGAGGGPTRLVGWPHPPAVPFVGQPGVGDQGRARPPGVPRGVGGLGAAPGGQPQRRTCARGLPSAPRAVRYMQQLRLGGRATSCSQSNPVPSPLATSPAAPALQPLLLLFGVLSCSVLP